MEAIIPLSQALKQMRSGDPFSIAFVAADLKRKKAGEYIEIPAAVVSTAADHQAPVSKELIPANKRPKSQTINILVVANRRVITVHTRLIKEFNGIQVYY